MARDAGWLNDTGGLGIRHSEIIPFETNKLRSIRQFLLDFSVCIRSADDMVG